MGTIKDLVDLVTQLNDSVQDRKFAAELREVQRMILTFQSEHSSLAEKYHKLLSENSELKQTILSLEKEDAKSNGVQPPVNKNIPEEPAKILAVLAERESMTSDQIAHMTNLSPVKAEYWLQKLENDVFIYGAHFFGGSTEYSLAQNGREYLIENGLV